MALESCVDDALSHIAIIASLLQRPSRDCRPQCQIGLGSRRLAVCLKKFIKHPISMRLMRSSQEANPHLTNLLPKTTGNCGVCADPEL